ncbi:GerAB/ArcD/ProY family transporter [Paenibacillus sp. CF384]|uniref:GerAB/ArcD/ProY family transporter n=1 Tax=Paenibacillus sp. CF384 TaxID=1884382 RepID=UPI00089CF351|nr:GerAB/ArcD/ProY family transporter [Paenibacillus sp. CF384]SDX84293.1 Spore germination protein [Paenibacillus sp. CF384]
MEQDRLTAWQLFYIALGIQGGSQYLLVIGRLIKLGGTSAWLYVLVFGTITGLMLMLMEKVLTGGKQKDFVANHLSAFGNAVGVILLLFFVGWLFIYETIMLNETIGMFDEYQAPNLQTYWSVIPLVICAVVAAKGGVRVIAGLFFVALGLRLIEHVIIILGSWDYIELRSVLPLWNGERPKFESISTSINMFNGIELLVFLKLFTSHLKTSQIRRAIWGAIGMQVLLSMDALFLILSVFEIDFASSRQQITMVDFFKVVSLPFLEQIDQVGVAALVFRLLPDMSLGLWIVAMLMRKLIFRKLSEMAHLCIWAALLVITARVIWHFQKTLFLGNVYPAFTFGMLLVYLPIYVLLSRRGQRRASGGAAPIGGEANG